MSKKNTTMQDLFLNQIRIQKVAVTIFLSSGIKLQGQIISFDVFTIVLQKDTIQQLIYKHSVATIVPNDKNFKVDISLLVDSE